MSMALNIVRKGKESKSNTRTTWLALCKANGDKVKYKYKYRQKWTKNCSAGIMWSSEHEHFYSPSNTYIAIVGDINIK